MFALASPADGEAGGVRPTARLLGLWGEAGGVRPFARNEGEGRALAKSGVPSAPSFFLQGSQRERKGHHVTGDKERSASARPQSLQETEESSRSLEHHVHHIRPAPARISALGGLDPSCNTISRHVRLPTENTLCRRPPLGRSSRAGLARQAGSCKPMGCG